MGLRPQHPRLNSMHGTDAAFIGIKPMTCAHKRAPSAYKENFAVPATHAHNAHARHSPTSTQMLLSKATSRATV